MVRKHPGFSLLAAVLAFGAGQSSALAASPIFSSGDISATEVITFEGAGFGEISDATLFSSQGVTFTSLAGESIAFGMAGGSFSQNVLDVSDGEVFLDLAAGFTAAGVDYLAAPGQELFFTAYDASNTEILAVHIASSGWVQTGCVGVDAGSTDIRHIVIHDDAGQFFLDNLTLGTTAGASSTPVPTAALLGVLGLGMVGLLKRRFG